MKRSAFVLLILGLFVSMHAYAEDTNAAPATTTATEATAKAAVAAVEAPASPIVAPAPHTDAPASVTAAATPPAPVAAPAPEAVGQNANADNHEFISGEVGELNEAGKNITVKLYGETESATTDKTLKVSVDSSTDITDGEQDRDFKSLAVGTEVDVEYDPATNKATYIFVY